MSTATLQRCELELPVTDEPLHKRATELLGYNGLRMLGISFDAAVALSEQGIRPFSSKSVERYKRTESRRANRWLIVAAVLWGAFCLGLPWLLVLWFRDPGAFFTYIITLSLGTALGLGAMQAWWKTWQQTFLSRYARPIPTCVLDLACDLAASLKKHGVEHVFFVEELAITPSRVDPFLVLEINGKQLHLEVWDEPNFGAQRTV